VQVGDREDVQPWGEPGLGEEHGAELAGADQAHADRLAGLGPLPEKMMEIHGRAPRIPCPDAYAAGQSSGVGTKKKEAVTASQRVMLLEQLPFPAYVDRVTTNGFPQPVQDL
jgi:hypothetical protein